LCSRPAVLRGVILAFVGSPIIGRLVRVGILLCGGLFGGFRSCGGELFGVGRALLAILISRGRCIRLRSLVLLAAIIVRICRLLVLRRTLRIVGSFLPPLLSLFLFLLPIFAPLLRVFILLLLGD